MLSSMLGKRLMHLRNRHRRAESLRVEDKNWTNKGHLLGGLYYRTPEGEEHVEEALLFQLQEAHSHHDVGLQPGCLLENKVQSRV